MSKQNYDIKTLQDYLAGKLDPMAMHALERQALEDPLLCEALEGLAENPEWRPEDLESGMERLNARLERRVAASAATSDLFLAAKDNDETTAFQSGTPVEPLYRAGGKKKWWGAAAIILVLLAGGWYYFASQGVDKATERLQSDSEIASAVNKALTDSNTRDNGSNIAKKDKGPEAATVTANGAKTEKQSRVLPEHKTSEAKSVADHKLAKAPVSKKPAALGPESLSLAQAPVAPSAGLRAGRFRALQPSITDSIVAGADGLPSMQSVALGKVPGIAVMDGAAVKENGARFYIRGDKSILDTLLPGQSGGPLIVVDGTAVSGNKLDSIDPNNIAHMEVLKGAAALAIYGERGGNGVVLITTKSFASHAGIGANQLAYLKKDKISPSEKGVLSNKSIAARLNGKVSGLKLDAPAALGVTLQVDARRLSGSLQPKGGFKVLERYLKQQWITGFSNKVISLQDTGIVKAVIRIEDEAYGHGTVFELNKDGHRPAFINWLNAVLVRGPQWVAGQSHALNAADSSERTSGDQQDSGPAIIEIYFIHR